MIAQMHISLHAKCLETHQRRDIFFFFFHFTDKVHELKLHAHSQLHVSTHGYSQEETEWHYCSMERRYNTQMPTSGYNNLLHWVVHNDDTMRVNATNGYPAFN